MVIDSGVRSDVAHLLRRAAFGGSAAEIDTFSGLGYDAAVTAVCEHTAADAGADGVHAPSFDTAAYLAALRSDDVETRRQAQRQLRVERLALVTWWLQRMVDAAAPWREKLTLLWHDHFATSIAKVKPPALMHRQ